MGVLNGWHSPGHRAWDTVPARGQWGESPGKAHHCFSFGQEESRRLGAGMTQEAEMLAGKGTAGPTGMTLPS